MQDYNENSMLKVDELATILRIGRGKAYQLVKETGFPVVKIGKSLRVPYGSFIRWRDNKSIT